MTHPNPWPQGRIDFCVSVLRGRLPNHLDVAIALSFMVAAVYVLLFLLRLGWIADLIPDPVLKGVIEGLVWLTILKQMPKLLGLELEG